MRVIQTVALSAAVALLVACGGGGAGSAVGGVAQDDPRPATGTVVFKMDASTCNGSLNMVFSANGKQVGNEVLRGGESSKGYTAAAGANDLTADAINGPTWAHWTAHTNVTANGTITLTLGCFVKR